MDSDQSVTPGPTMPQVTVSLSLCLSPPADVQRFSEGVLECTGLRRAFLFRRLAPFTVCMLTLEACTQAGCPLGASA